MWLCLAGHVDAMIGSYIVPAFFSIVRFSPFFVFFGLIHLQILEVISCITVFVPCVFMDMDHGKATVHHQLLPIYMKDFDQVLGATCLTNFVHGDGLETAIICQKRKQQNMF